MAVSMARSSTKEDNYFLDYEEEEYSSKYVKSNENGGVMVVLSMFMSMIMHMRMHMGVSMLVIMISISMRMRVDSMGIKMEEDIT